MDTVAAVPLRRHVEAQQLPVEHRHPAWRRLGQALLAFAAFRVATALLGVVAAGGGSPSPLSPTLLRPWLQWDVYWHVAIATGGYSAYSHVQNGPNVYYDAAAFQPLLPGLMHVGAALLGITAYEAGLVVCAMAVVLGIAGLLTIAEADLPAGAAPRAVLALLLFPTALFFASAYTESLILAEVVWAFVAVRRNRPGWAALIVALAVLTKAYTIVLVAPLAVELWTRRPDRRRFVEGFIALCAGALGGAAALTGYFAWLDHDPFRFLSAYAGWGHHATAPWTAVSDQVGSIARAFSAYSDMLLAGANLGAMVLLGWTAWHAWHRQRMSHCVLTIVMLIVLMTNGLTASAARYALVCFPVYLAVADAGTRRLGRLGGVVTICAASLIAADFAARFAQGQWVG